MKEILLKVQYLEKLHKILNDLPFLPEKIKIEKVEKLVGNLHDGNEFSIHISNLKEALNNGFVLKNTHRVIKLTQHHLTWLVKFLVISIVTLQKLD